MSKKKVLNYNIDSYIIIALFIYYYISGRIHKFGSYAIHFDPSSMTRCCCLPGAERRMGRGAGPCSRVGRR